MLVNYSATSLLVLCLFPRPTASYSAFFLGALGANLSAAAAAAFAALSACLLAFLFTVAFCSSSLLILLAATFAWYSLERASASAFSLPQPRCA